LGDAARWSGYDASNPRLIALYAKGKVLQWDGGVAIDWDRPVDPGAPVHAEAFPLLALPIFTRLGPSQRDALTATFMEGALSQFLHGEQGALMVASRLVGACPDYEAKLYAATQTMDEARHVEVFGRYLQRCGTIQPVDPSPSSRTSPSRPTKRRTRARGSSARPRGGSTSRPRCRSGPCS
jgi:hypothetical protein